jgi:hypothetical protein
LLRRPKAWPLANHYHFHILDKQWGHITIRISGYPPFGAQILLNGHEWVERRARQQSIGLVKEANCFVSGSDLSALSRLAEGLGGVEGLARLAQVWSFLFMSGEYRCWMDTGACKPEVVRL